MLCLPKLFMQSPFMHQRLRDLYPNTKPKEYGEYLATKRKKHINKQKKK